MLRAGNLRSERRFPESDGILKNLEQSEASFYILAFERGGSLLDWGKSRESTAEFRTALVLNTSFEEAWVALGRAAFALREDEEAIKAYRRTLHFNPRNYLARRSLARAYWREVQPEQAGRELAQVVSEHPDFAEARAEHGLALVKVTRYQEAIPEPQSYYTIWASRIRKPATPRARSRLINRQSRRIPTMRLLICALPSNINSVGICPRRASSIAKPAS
ncbi:MAG TPA: tetratricopeptide repeat protein [Terriglobia bacterium]|nr:tetratricopeptide repeat protein [Terriglobia bacterium]